MIEEKKMKEPALYKGIGVALSKKGRKVINKKVEDYMITKPYIYHLEDLEFKQSEWMGKRKLMSKCSSTTNQTKNSSKLVRLLLKKQATKFCKHYYMDENNRCTQCGVKLK